MTPTQKNDAQRSSMHLIPLTVDKLRDQVQMTANKFAGDRYVKFFKEMGKFYDSKPNQRSHFRKLINH